MIKQAELNAAYQQGRYAAMVKLAEGDEEKKPSLAGNAAIMAELQRQNEIRQLIGLGGQGLSHNQQIGVGAGVHPEGGTKAFYNPMNYATMENAARAGMLGGAAGGAYLGGMDPRAAAMASAGALGGGMVGGNLGRGLGNAIDAYRGAARGGIGKENLDRLISGGGALGGLGGGLAAGAYS